MVHPRRALRPLSRVEYSVIFEKLIFTITSKLSRITTEHIYSICSLESELYFGCLCFVGILDIFEVIAKMRNPSLRHLWRHKRPGYSEMKRGPLRGTDLAISTRTLIYTLFFPYTFLQAHTIHNTDPVIKYTHYNPSQLRNHWHARLEGCFRVEQTCLGDNF